MLIVRGVAPRSTLATSSAPFSTMDIIVTFAAATAPTAVASMADAPLRECRMRCCRQPAGRLACSMARMRHPSGSSVRPSPAESACEVYLVPRPLKDHLKCRGGQQRLHTHSCLLPQHHNPSTGSAALANSKGEALAHKTRRFLTSF
uniref:Uncharacterized protein n=1 Tax=Haptolina brevifila TaxID=156173 RepID=A0A7S2IT80_9EUKA